MNTSSLPVDCFVLRLERLPQADLRLLRAVKGNALGNNVAAFDLFMREFWWNEFVGVKRAGFRRSACFTVATMFPWHPQRHGQENMGHSLGRLFAMTKSDQAQLRVKHRFGTLIALSGQQQEQKLKAAIRNLASAEIPLNWRQLLMDLNDWDNPAHTVQKHWAKSFFKFSGTVH